MYRSGRILTALLPFPRGIWRPESWLSSAPTGARGAWSDHEGWAVHGGAAARLTTGPDRRFQRIRELAEERTGIPLAEEGAGAPAPRFYGGFSYGGPETGLWAPLGAAYFVLPEWELRSVGEGTVLLVHALPESDGADGPDDGPHPVDLRDRVRELRERLLERPSGREATDPAVPVGGEAPGDAGTERDRWLGGVEAALQAIESGRLQKVVLARGRQITSRLTPPEGLAALRARLPGPGGTFLVQPEPECAFLGSSPEQLTGVRGTRFTATAVAGSVRRGAGPEADRRQGRALLESAKNRREQAIVAEEIQERLSSLATAVRVSDPGILRLPDILHLESRIEARLSRRRHVLEILSRIHPTPAVCGRPRSEAEDFLRAHEDVERGWYAGPMGWFDVWGDGSFSPGLRSGLWRAGQWRLFAGAGIVTGSDPAREWKETELKLGAIRRGFGLAGP